MIHEKSCGAVIYDVSCGTIKYLIEKMRRGHYSICKGHVENDETEYQTARREIMEETGISVKFKDGFRNEIEYSPYQGCLKRVVFFLAEAESTETFPQECEVSDIYWLPYDEACELLTHESDRNVLKNADEFIKMM